MEDLSGAAERLSYFPLSLLTRNISHKNRTITMLFIKLIKVQNLFKILVLTFKVRDSAPLTHGSSKDDLLS